MEKNDGGVLVKVLLNRLLIVVLNYVSYNLTITCVDRIKGADAKIIIVDNCSPNESYNVLFDYYKNEKSVLVVKSDYNGGYAYGNNYGVRYGIKHFTNINYIAIMNPDVVVSQDTISQLALILEKDKEISVVAPYVMENGKTTKDSCGWILWNKSEIIKSASYIFGRNLQKNTSCIKQINEFDCVLRIVEAVKGCFFLIRREDFESVGWFDEHTFLYGEEDILGYRIRELGKMEACVMNLKCEHNHLHSSFEKKISNGKIHLRRSFHSRRMYLLYCENATRLELFLFDLLKTIHINIEYPMITLLKRLITGASNDQED